MLTPHKYIQHRVTESGREEYLVILPVRLYPTRTLTVVCSLEEAVQARNEFLGYDADHETEEKMTDFDARDIKPGKTVRFGALGDTHLGSKYERLDVLHALYDIYEEQGITTVFHTGNWIEGEASFNREDISVFGVGNQFDYFFAKYPKRTGITTYFVAGDDHEGWYWKKHGIPLSAMWAAKAEEWGRDDMVYLGYQEADFEFPLPEDDGILVRIVHPGGGSAKSISLQAQNEVDGYHPDEMPDVLLVGHYHKAHHMPDYKGVLIIQTGTCQDKTPFIKKNKIAVHIGGWIVAVNRMTNGCIAASAMFLPFRANKWRMRESVDRKFLAPDEFDFDAE